MNDREILDKVTKIVHENLSVTFDEVTPYSNFATDLGADSLAIEEIIMAVEEEFNIDKVPDEVIEKIATVQDVVDYISFNSRRE